LYGRRVAPWRNTVRLDRWRFGEGRHRGRLAMVTGNICNGFLLFCLLWRFPRSRLGNHPSHHSAECSVAPPLGVSKSASTSTYLRLPGLVASRSSYPAGRTLRPSSHIITLYHDRYMSLRSDRCSPLSNQATELCRGAPPAQQPSIHPQHALAGVCGHRRRGLRTAK
jgi:hypothetical protein